MPYLMWMTVILYNSVIIRVKAAYLVVFTEEVVASTSWGYVYGTNWTLWLNLLCGHIYLNKILVVLICNPVQKVEA